MVWYDPVSWFDGGEEFTADPDPNKWEPGTEAQPVNEGTTHYRPDARLDDIKRANGDWMGYDERNYEYGRDPGAADAAVNKAFGTGDNAVGFGNYVIGHGEQAGAAGAAMQGERNTAADAFNNRSLIQGQWGQQNLTLGKLGGLEAQEGPSAAQAQLQAGTNQAMGSQIALARSGRGFGGSAGASGLAQTQLAGLGASNANQAAALRAQENAAWRGRQAANLGNVAGMQGQQSQADLSARLGSQAQNDAMYQNQTALGQDAYFKGQGVQMGGYGVAQHGVDQNIAAQSLADQIRGKEMTGGSTQEDNIIRAWAAKNGYTLAGQQAQDQKEAGYVGAGATLLGAAATASDIRGKTNIVPSDDAGRDFARGGDYSGGAGENMIRDPWAGRPGRALGLDATPYQPSGDAPMTPMQAQYMGGKPDGGGQSGAPAMAESTFAPSARPDTSKPFDLDSLDASSLDAVRNSPASFYDYKDPGAPGADAQRHYGPMAQDLAKTPAGRSAVTQMPDGKLGVDTGRLALVQHGAISAQQKQLDAIQAQLDAFSKKPSSVNPSQVYGGDR